MLKKSIRFLSVLTIFGVFLALMTMQGAPSGVASAQGEELRVPLGADCDGVAPLPAYPEACCIFGHVYLNDEIIEGATVSIESDSGTLTPPITTMKGSQSQRGEPYYRSSLTSPPLSAKPGEMVTITVSYNDMVSTRTWEVQPGSQQVDMGLIEGYQASEPFSTDSAFDQPAANTQAEGDMAMLAGASADSKAGQAVTNVANLSDSSMKPITAGSPDTLNRSVAPSQIKLTASDGAAGDYFGRSVSIDGDVAIVGAPNDDDNGSDSGAAYIYRWDGNGNQWVREAKLTASDGASEDIFGWSVSIDGNVALVGAPGTYPSLGSAYIYRLRGSQWQEEGKLLASDGARGDWFGYSVSIDGDAALVGAFWDDDNGRNSGSAYIYRLRGNQWQEESKLLASDGAQGEEFGFDVSIDSDVALVGARNGNGYLSGSAYIYRLRDNQWQEESKLVASDIAYGDYFGQSVSISGNWALIGAYANDDNGTNSGSAYIYHWDGNQWQYESKLLASNAAPNDWFGHSVSIDGDVALVGAFSSTYIYRWDDSQWQEESKLLAGGVSTDGNRALIGAPGDDDNGEDSGAAYVYDLSSGPGEPDIALSPASISATVKEGQSSNDTLVIRNMGASDLTWQVSESATWLSIASTSGTVTQGGSASVTVGFDASGLSAGTYADTLTITSNDPDEASIEVPVSLVVGSLNITEFKLTASDGAVGDGFGNAVSIDGDVAIVGATWDDDNGDSSGSAYIYRRNGSQWVQEAKLLASDGGFRDYFGGRVSIDGDVAIVSASGDNNLSGSAYVYRRNGSQWVQEAKLLASDGAAGDRFGLSVSIDGDVALVGAYQDDDNGLNSGSAYIYRRNGNQWVEESKLLASDGTAGNSFGWSVSISDNVALVGARVDNDNGTNSGSAYIYRWNGSQWVEEIKLLPSDGTSLDYFGQSLSIDGNVALVGAPGDSEAAYIYRWDGNQWVEESKLLASDGAQGDDFGWSVSISGNVALVAARYDDDNGEDSGSAYIYHWDGSQWQEKRKLLASDGAAEDEFGRSVSIGGNVALVGAYRDDDNGGTSGSAYVYDLFSDASGADIAVSSASISATVDEGQSSSEMLVISNEGTSSLEWQVSESATWLSVAPTSGTVAQSGSTSITLNFDASGLSAGNYTDRLTITSNDPDEASVEVPITLVVGDYDPPMAAFSASVMDGGEPLDVQFTDESSGDIVSWMWDFGDGTSSGARHPKHLYTLERTYTVTLTVSGPGGEDSETKVNHITVGPPKEVNTLILTNRQKVVDLHGEAWATDLMDELGKLAAHDRVKGEVIQVESDPDVASAYAAWDADPKNTVKANAVTSAIKDVIDAKLFNSSYPYLEYIVVAGDDRVIPFRRVRDKTWYPEDSYCDQVSSDSVTGAALCDNMTLTDDYYAHRVPRMIPTGPNWDGQPLYLPYLAIGRLIETPEDMIKQIKTFLAGDGIAVNNAVVTGYTFVADGARKTCNILNREGVTSDCDLIGNDWSKDDFIDTVLDTSHNLTSISAHADHYRFGAPDESVVTSSDIANASDIDQRALFYTIACHSGLNVSDENPNPLDTAQALAQKQVNYVANTGYGWGDVYSVGLSEQLMIDFSRELTRYGQTTLGEALKAAKQQYYFRSYEFGYYDEKTLIQSTLYGLPMYQVTSPSSQRAPLNDELPAGVVKQETPFWLYGYEGLRKLQIDLDIDLDLPALTKEVITDTGTTGTFYTLDGLVHSQHGEPMQPKLSFDVSEPYTNAHGIVFRGGTYSDISNFDPVIAQAFTVTYSSGVSSEPPFTETNWYPAIPSQLNTLDNGAQAQMTTLLGQYNRTIAGGTERLYSELNVDVYYHTDSDDWTEPTIASIESELDAGTATVTVDTSDDSGIHEVLVTHTDQNGTWQSTSLTDNGNTWSHNFPATENTQFFVQVVDNAGNVAVDDNNGRYYDPIRVDPNVRITNVHDTTLTVSWLTESPMSGEVHYGTDSNNLNLVAYDERGQTTRDDTHYVNITGLNPNTTYYFTVVSDDVTSDNNGQPYAVTTGETLSPPRIDTIYGQAKKSDGSTLATGSIVYITLQDDNERGSNGSSAPLSALVDEDGYWYANLKAARSTDLSRYFNYSASGDLLQLEAHGASDGQKCETEVDTSNDYPAPDLILSDDICVDSWEINIPRGWSYVALPIQPITPFTAKQVCEDIAAQGGTISEINRWYNGNWSAHVCGEPFNDFELELGSGYFIKSNQRSTWVIDGLPVTTAPSLSIQTGWNSISIPHSESYSAKSLCSNINSQGVTAIEIDYWDNGGWSSHVCDWPFNDFNLERGKGYFVKAGSSGTVTPSASGLSRRPRSPATESVLTQPAAVPTNRAVAVRNVQVSNLRDNSATISWTTNESTTGHVRYGQTTQLDNTAYDMRGNDVAQETHYVVLSDLTPETTYYFKVVSGGNDESATALSFTTGATLDIPPSDTVYGRVYMTDGVTPAAGSLLYLTLQDADAADSQGNAAMLSTLVDDEGYWHANLGNARTVEGEDYFLYSASDTVKLTVQGANGTSIEKTINTDQMRPADALTLEESAYQIYMPLVIGQ